MTNYVIPKELAKKKKSLNKVVGFRISQELVEKIDNLAKTNHMSKADVIQLSVDCLIDFCQPKKL